MPCLQREYATVVTAQQAGDRSWNAAVDGVHAVYLSFQPDLAVPGAPETVGAFARTAVQAGVERLVLLSGRGEEEAFHEAVAEIALASGRSITFRTVPLPEYAAMLSEVGVPADEVALLKYLFGEVLDGRKESVTDGVRQVLGRPATPPRPTRRPAGRTLR
jgi:hypothetical protein